MRSLIIALVAACAPRPTVPAAAPDAPEADQAPDASGPAAAQAVRTEALAAYAKGDHATFLAKSQRAVALDPTTIVDRYNVACGHALLGHPDKAFAALGQLADEGVDFGFARDPDFTSLHGDPRWKPLVARVDALFPVVTTGERAFDMGGALGIVPEGIAHDPATGRFFVGSMRTGAVYAIGAEGGVTELARLEIGGNGVAALGLEVDAARNRLWAVGTAFGLHEGFRPELEGVSGLFGLDLATGEIEELHVPEAGSGATFNDLTVAPSGAIYLSGGPPHVFRPGDDVGIEPLPIEPAMAYSNGITATQDGTALYVAADLQSIGRVDLETMAWSYLALPEGVNLRSFDGLYHVPAEGPDALVGVQLGLGHWRVVRVDLDEAGTAVTGIEVLEQRNPGILSATTGVVVGDGLVVIARGPVPEGADVEAVGPLGAMGGPTFGWRVPIHP